ncbi:MAG: glycoside hydrolase family 3 protein [Acidobacteria bacterium]|nr:glycoside hydrolase family 3 protein [Acidobacteriota bacterium]MBI3657293.1 glycoside hydrolase family 3 protein [Acidobacteriota bacterium]
MNQRQQPLLVQGREQRQPIQLFSLALALLLISFALAQTPHTSPDTNEQLKTEIGQMLLIGFRGATVATNPAIIKTIRECRLGGVVLSDYDVPSRTFGRNIISPSQLRKLTADLQKLAPTPLFIAVDVEGGQINRLKPKHGFKDFPSHQALGRLNDVEKTYATAVEIAKELRALGINWNYAPVVDLNLNPANPIIGGRQRAFSADPALVAKMAGAFVRAHRTQNVISVLKHFPGHGSSQGDTHRGLQDVTTTWRDSELDPYRELNRAGLIDAIMTAHVTHIKIDPEYPATLSPKFLNDLLRVKIGFKGVIITDDLGMGAITQNYGLADALIRAVNAGADILLLANNSPQPYDADLPARAARILADAVGDGRIRAARIHESYQRIMELKQRFHIMP